MCTAATCVLRSTSPSSSTVGAPLTQNAIAPRLQMSEVYSGAVEVPLPVVTRGRRSLTLIGTPQKRSAEPSVACVSRGRFCESLSLRRSPYTLL